MFGKSKDPASNAPHPRAGEAGRGDPRAEGAAGRAPDLPRRSGSYALPGTRRGEQRMPVSGASGSDRRLVVGREISLTGEITACETLVVEGKVEADLKDCTFLQIAVSGLYKGAATVEQADISGHFDGDLTVTGTLMLRSTGRVNGRLAYGEMEIERGGKITGSLEDIPPPGKTAEKPVEKPAAKPAETKPAATRAAPAKAEPAPRSASPAAAADGPKADDLVTRAQSGNATAT